MRRVVPVVIVLLLILGVGGSIAWKILADRYSPSSDYIDYAVELGLGADEYAITLNHELLTDYRALSSEGKIYLPLELVSSSINSRFYLDDKENKLLYAFPEEIAEYVPGETVYKVRSWGDESEKSSEYPILIKKEETLYVAADYVAANTQMDYASYEKPGRVVMQTSWGEESTVKSNRQTAIRYKGGVKSEVLRMSEDGEEMYLIEAFDDWYNVATDDGYIGWVSRKHMNEPVQKESKAPDFDFPEYKSIKKDYRINMAWHQVMNEYANSGVSDVLQSDTGINTISPTWFYFSDTDGNVASTATADYVSACHEKGVEVWALFSNEFPAETDRIFDTAKTEEVLSYSSKRKLAIEQLMGYVKEYDIDGINLDFELISVEGAPQYLEFIRELSIACRAEGVVLSVDSYVPEFTPYYNRREQAAVVDYVVIMCYDETDATSTTPGPTASAGFVSKGISDTLAVADKSKVIIAIPFFTRVWSTGDDGTVNSFACGMNEALGYLTGHGVTPEYQETSGLNYGSYKSDLDGRLYEIWLQDADSVKAEMDMIRESEVAGSAVWRIGYESGSEIWDIIRQ